jgi:hypothetical protein
MRRPRRKASARSEKPAVPTSPRDRFAIVLGVVTALCLGAVFLISSGAHFLMPGPLSSAHGAIETCSSCHTKSGNGKLSWFHGLVAGNPLDDSKACLTCHRMPDTALNAHSASGDVLKASTRRLTKVAAETPAPSSVLLQSAAFPTAPIVERGVFCATCHQEHKGVNFDLKKISNEQCHSCHSVKFDSFDGDHPKFDSYPFKRRTRLIYDHTGHFTKHFPEFAKKKPELAIPNTCATCHTSRADKRVMAVTSFDETCTTCHLNQILGKERASGPKGIAFLTIPGIDLQTLKDKNASIGEWPEASEAELTPFMKVMIARSDRGRALIKTLSGVNLQDLSGASDDQIKAVTAMVWEIKGLIYELIAGKASDVLGNLNIGGGAKLSASLVTDLTASLPRDVVISAHQEWLPNLATEMAERQAASEQNQSGWGSSVTETKLSGAVPPEELVGLGAREAAPRPAPQAAEADADAGGFARTIRLAQANQQVQSKSTYGTIAEKTLRVDAYGDVSKAPEREANAAPQPGAAAAPVDASTAAPAAEASPAAQQPVEAAAVQQAPAGAGSQEDDLLYPTPEELRSAGLPDDGGAQPAASAPVAASGGDAPSPSGGAVVEAAPSGDAAADSPAAASGWETAAVDPQLAAAPVITIQTDIDPESWAEYGGWYRQDYAIFYRPTGHKDKFIYSWLFLTGPQARKGDKGPAAAVFDYLTAKDAQGSCVKCHSVDDISGGARLVNFSPPKVETKKGRFTNFIHEPHFGIMEDRGCLTCHNLQKGSPYLKTYEQGDHRAFSSNFSPVKKELCQSCHASGMARQECLLCHKYHLDGVFTPIMNTRLPAQ